MNPKYNKYLYSYAMPLGLLVLIVLLQVFNLEVPLFSSSNLKNILLQTVSIALASLGLSYIMISGEGDISFAGMFSLLTVIFATVSNRTDSFFVAFIATFLIVACVNFLIATFVTRLNFSSFIVSIAVMFMANGVEKAIHQQTTLINSKEIKAFATVEAGLALVVWIMFLLFIISYCIVNKTVFGYNLRIIGENSNAGIEAGIHGGRMKTFAYLIAAFLLAMSATVEATRVGAVYEQGKLYMLPIFTACYLGSSMFVPGRVNIVGTLTGALFMGIINNFMKMMNVESFIIPIVQGSILIIAVGLSVFKNRKVIQQVKI